MSIYPKTLYVRVVNPGTDNEFLLTGTEPSDVADTAVGDNDSVLEIVGRYKLVGTGQIYHTAPQYVEDTVA